MQAGKLRHRIKIEWDAGVQDPGGQHIPKWTLLCEVWAEVKGVSGTEFIRGGGQQVQANIDSVISIRYLAGVKPKMRVLHGERILNIDSIRDPDGRRRELILNCRENV